MDVQEAKLVGGEFTSFINLVEKVQKGLETHTLFNIAAFKPKGAPVCLKNLPVFTREEDTVMWKHK